MAIGSKVIGKAVVAGQYGIIQAETGLVGLSQTVQLVDPAKTLATVEQSVEQIDRASRLVSFTQRVVADSVDAVFVPLAYVELNGVILTCSTAYNNVRVTHNEDQSSTATMNVTYPTGMVINMPSFHGKPVRILVHEDENDITSELIPLFTGWVESAKHDLKTQSIDFTCSDLRDERLGREDGQALKQLTGGLYSNVTQREDVSGREYVTELMKTVSGSLGYTRSGGLRYHSWGVGTKPVNLTLTDADVSYSDLTTEFQTRSSVINSVTVNMRYRWNKLHSIHTSFTASKGRPTKAGEGTISAGIVSGTYNLYDWTAFRRADLLARRDSFSPWQTLSFSIVPLQPILSKFEQITASIIVIDKLWPVRHLWGQGFNAKLVRHIAQPVTESYTFTVTAPQSVDAYGETVEGSELSFAAEVEYERNDWEQDFIEGEIANPTDAKAAEQAKADSRRADLADAFNAAYRIAKKEIVASHRNNYVEAKLHRIQPVEIGDIVQHDNRIVQTTGQCVGVEYTIADGQRQTSIRAAISYMDTAVPAPTENWTVPTAPTAPDADTTLQTVVTYDTDEKAFDIKLPDISEQITDEYAPTIAPLSFDLPLEINDITLINGY